MLANLQALRALAAIGVVIFHVGLMPGTSLPFQVGAAGVDIFFVLRGFIIAYSSSRDQRHFLPRRLLRILPAYWIATVIAAAFTLQKMTLPDAADWLVQSLFYLPHPQGRPVLIFVAWTLIYELAFYLLYWLALRTGARLAPVVALIVLPVLALVHVPGLPRPWPLLLEFALGIAIYLGVERFGLSQRIGKQAGLLMIGIGMALLPVLPDLTSYDSDDCESLDRVLTWGLPAAGIVLGAIVAEREGLAIRNRTVLVLGAASYAIYLLHPIVVGQLLPLPPIAPPLSWAACIGATALAVAIAVGFHLWIEKPLLHKFRNAAGDLAPADQRPLPESGEAQTA